MPGSDPGQMDFADMGYIATDLDGFSYNWLRDISLVCHWRLDEDSNNIAYDSSGYVNDGMLNGGPVWQPTSGQIAGALDFDGVDDYVTHNLDLPRSAGTISHWLYPDQVRMMVACYESDGTISRHWDGLIDDLRIYNRPLTPQEITDLAQ